MDDPLDDAILKGKNFLTDSAGRVHFCPGGFLGKSYLLTNPETYERELLTILRKIDKLKPFVLNMFFIFSVFIVARYGGDFFKKFKYPVVTGVVLIGMFIPNIVTLLTAGYLNKRVLKLSLQPSDFPLKERLKSRFNEKAYDSFLSPRFRIVLIAQIALLFVMSLFLFPGDIGGAILIWILLLIYVVKSNFDSLSVKFSPPETNFTPPKHGVWKELRNSLLIFTILLALLYLVGRF